MYYILLYVVKNYSCFIVLLKSRFPRVLLPGGGGGLGGMAHGPGPERIMRRPNIWAPFFHASTGEDGAYGQVESYEALATFLNHKLADYNQGQTCACPGGGCPTLLMMNSILMIQYCNSNSMCSNIRDGAKWSLHSTHCTPQPRTPPLSPPPPHTTPRTPTVTPHVPPPHTHTSA